jgi:hypothetical protein
MAKKNLETLIQEGLATLAGEVLTLSAGLTVQDTVRLNNEEPDINITRIVINSAFAYIISNEDIQLKEIIVKSSFSDLVLKNISDDCKIVVKEKARLSLLTNANINNRLSVTVPIDLGPTGEE